MIDPEPDHRRIVSGDAGALAGGADTLADVGHDLDDARGRIHDAAATTDWIGPGAASFQARVATLASGVNVNRTAAARARGALDTAATAYATAVQQADHYIAFWRNRPGAMIPVLEQILALAVRARLIEVATTYSQQLTGIAALIRGEDVDLDTLDEETRAWVERGLEKNREWAEQSGSTFGPLIPNTAATGDRRGLIPQGLAYDPRTGTYVMSYYTKEKTSTLALVDAVTGQEIGDVELGAPRRGPLADHGPEHAGGVSVQGDEVVVVDKGRVYTYSMSDIRSHHNGGSVTPTAVQTVDEGGSYSALHDGKLYLGDYETGKLYVYGKDAFGGWQPVRDASGQPEVHDTPAKAQGLVVRDDEFVFSTSPNRFDEGTLVVQNRETGERTDPYFLPNMAEGVVEVDGDLVTTYESSAAYYDNDGSDWGWFPGVPDDDDLWANPHLTLTPLSALGLSDDLEVQPSTLRQASHALDRPSRQLSSASSTVRGVRVLAADLGEVPGASTFASTVTILLSGVADSLRSGSQALALVSDNLMDSARDYQGTDDVVGGVFRGVQP